MKRILIVEDDMALAQELQYLLISNQYDAQCVEEFTDVAGQILASQADMVLLLHIEAVFKRLGKMDADKGLTYKNMTLDTARGVLTVGDNSVELTKNEAGILSYLLKHQNTIVTRDELISYLWDSEAFVDDNTLTVNMNRVRKKLSDLGVEDVIRTKRGQGYILA